MSSKDPAISGGSTGGEAAEDAPVTERTVERRKEDDRWVPVIVKRTDQARRHPDDILERAVEEGLEQIERATLSLALSSVAAGLILGFTAMAVAVASKAVAGLDDATITRVATALVYPIGFVICIMSGAELFTEHTATAVYPVLDRRSSLRRLLRLWALVIGGNLIGAALSSWLLVLADPVVEAREGYVEIGHHLTSPDGLPLFISAVLAGWLMALGAWLVLATPPTVSQIASIYMVTFLIGIGGLHHSIAGAVEIFTAWQVDETVGLADVVRFVSVAAFGNLVGGSIFVAVLNYGHIRELRRAVDD